MALAFAGCPAGNERIADVWDTSTILTDTYTNEIAVFVGEIVFFTSGEGIWYVPNRVEDTTPELFSYTIIGDTVRLLGTNTFTNGVIQRRVNFSATMVLDGPNLMTGDSTRSVFDDGVFQSSSIGIDEFTR